MKASWNNLPKGVGVNVRTLALLVFLLVFAGILSAQAAVDRSSPQSLLAASTYYVSPSGNDNNPGTIGSPWKTPGKAGSTAQAGDTVIFRGGEYHGQLAPKNSGNPSGGWITFKAYPGEEPIIIYDAYWSKPISIDGVNFIEVNGLTAVGAGPNGPGIGINRAHHIRIINCVARDSAESGINTTESVDYITIEGNRVYGNSNRGQYQGSGISIWRAGGLNYDDKPGYHIIIRNNLIYDNRNLQDNPTDGNGIILDNNDRGDTPDLQNPKTLIANNVIFNNGGRCIHALNSSNVDIVHNTCYHNVETNKISNGCNGEISLQRFSSFTSAINIRVFNNVVYGKGGTCSNGSQEAYVFQVWCSQFGCPQFTSDYNLWYNGAVERLGSHDIVADPQYVNPSLDPMSADFRLKPSSAAIDSGTDQFAAEVPTDYLGISRPRGDSFDMGAYEWFKPGVNLAQNQAATQLPGTAVTYSFTVTNESNLPDTFILDVPTNPLSWTVVNQPGSVDLLPGASTTVGVNVTVPEDAAGGVLNAMTVRATSQSDDEVIDDSNLHVTVANVGGVSIGPDLAKEGEPAQDVKYLHTLTNNGNFVDSITISGVSSNGWTASAQPAVAIVPAGGYMPVTVTVSVPPGQAAGLVDVTTVTAASSASAGITSDIATETTTVAQMAGVELSPDNHGSYTASTDVIYSHTLENTGNGSDTFNLSVVSSQGWLVILSDTSVTLAAGGTETIQVTVRVPVGASATDVTTVTSVSSYNPGVSDTATDTTQFGYWLYLPIINSN